MKFIFTAAFSVAVELSLSGRSAEARETGLSIGNNPQVVSISGSVSIACFDPVNGNDFATYSCQRWTLDPAEYSRFQTSAPVDADYFYLKATHEDGSTRKKSGDYVASTGRSREQINLWITTLFQRPLLEPGVNKVAYELQKSGRTVDKGNFTVNVTRGQDRVCPNATIHSSDINDCRIARYACDRYFFEYNYCQ